MTSEEAICVVSELAEYFKTPKERKALRLAIEALKKRILKKPESDYVEFFAEGNNVRRKWYYTCPSCGNELDTEGKYCKDCGQKILWEGENGNAAD